jgi:hypothetical protein
VSNTIAYYDTELFTAVKKFYSAGPKSVKFFHLLVEKNRISILIGINLKLLKN